MNISIGSIFIFLHKLDKTLRFSILMDFDVCSQLYFRIIQGKR